MNAGTLDPAVRVRVTVLGAITLLALVSVTSWPFPRLPLIRGDELVLTVTAFRGGATAELDEVLPMGADELRFSGTVSKACHLFIFTVPVMGPARRVALGRDDLPGLPVGPGPFRMPGGFAFDLTPSMPVRFWAVCGPPELTYEDVIRAARTEVELSGSGATGVSSARRIEGLPDSVLQTTRLFRVGF